MVLPLTTLDDKTNRNLAEEAFRTHQPRIYRFLLRRTGNADDAEELTQQVFVDAAVALGSGRSQPDSLLGWLFTVAERRFVDEIRRRGRRERMSHRLARDEDVASVEYGPQIATAIRGAIARLPEEQRRAVVMKVLEGRSYDEIAGKLGASKAACKMRVSRALRRIRVDLEAEGFEP
jgi:RNA polymerase sigma-70 factor (ECF subfamily)